MRTFVVVAAVSSLAAVTAEASDLRRAMSGRLIPVQAVAVEPPALERAPREAVTRTPLPAPPVIMAQEAPVVSTQKTFSVPPQEAVAAPTADTASSAPQETASAAPAPAATDAPPAQTQPVPAPQQQPPMTVQPPLAMEPAPSWTSNDVTFSMPAGQLAAIGVGVLGGLVVLDGIGIPAAAAAFVGGLAGQAWYSYTYTPPAADYSVTQRITTRSWHDAAVRDGASMNRRWLQPVSTGQGG